MVCKASVDVNDSLEMQLEKYTPQGMPDIQQSTGLDPKRQWYLYLTHIRTLFAHNQHVHI